MIGGASPASLEHAVALYGKFIERVIPVSSTDAAEMVKLLENTFRAVNIGLVNEVAIMCGRLGLDTWEVIEAAATKPFGFMPFYPGPGLGGHCIPIDPALPVLEAEDPEVQRPLHRPGRRDQLRHARAGGDQGGRRPERSGQGGARGARSWWPG